MSKELIKKNIKDMKKIWGWQANFASTTQMSLVHPEILDDQIEFFIQSHISMLEEEIKRIKRRIEELQQVLRTALKAVYPSEIHGRIEELKSELFHKEKELLELKKML